MTGSRPLSPAYPRELTTLGDHVRKRRLDLGLRQRDVAARLGVDKDTVFNWETGRAVPTLRVLPRVIAFLGYAPPTLATTNVTLGGRLRSKRRALGWSQERLAEEFGLNPSTVQRWELGKGQPAAWLVPKLVGFLQRGASGSPRETP